MSDDKDPLLLVEPDRQIFMCLSELYSRLADIAERVTELEKQRRQEKKRTSA